MKKLFSGIINLEEGQSELEFQTAFDKWVRNNGWTYTQKNVIELPHNNLRVEHGSVLGSAIFHKDYEEQEDNDSETNRRYFLSRAWDSNLPVMCTFMMNPSAADEIAGDGTVDFMIRYAKYNGHGSIFVVNTSPIIKGSGTSREDFVLDEDNYFYIKYALTQADVVVLGWGENGQKFGIPLLKSNYSIRNLFDENIHKLRVFEYGNQGRSNMFPKHPHPQVSTHRFTLDKELKVVSESDLDMLL